MMETVKSNRMVAIDFVKGLAIICVCLGHSGVECGVATILWQSFFMSCFFIFSGYLYRKKGSMKDTLIHKTKGTLGVYYIWAIAIHFTTGAVQLLLHQIDIADWLLPLKDIVLGKQLPEIISQLWFLAALFSVELIWMIIDYLINDNRRKVCAVIAVSLGGGVLINSIGLVRLPFRFDVALMVTPLFGLGVALQNCDFTKINWKAVFPVAGLIWVCGVMINHNVLGKSVSLASGDYGQVILFYLNAIFGTLTFLSFSKVIDLLHDYTGESIVYVFRNAIAFYGKYSLTFLLSMNLCIRIAYKVLNIIKPPFYDEAQIKAIMAFGIVCLVQVPISKVITQTKLSRVLLLK